MSKYRNHLPQMNNDLFLTDGGLETTLVFQHGYELPQFAAFDLFKQRDGYDLLDHYYRSYAEIARANGVGFILESATWRASRDWGAKLGYRPGDLKAVNRASIAMLHEVRRTMESQGSPMPISGCVGPRGDGYNVIHKMTVPEAEHYHWEQIKILAGTEVDMVSAFTINYAEEAVGITRAAQKAGLPVAIGFTVETDGRLPSNQSLGEAIDTVDRATGRGPVYYMINCAHPTHFQNALAEGAPWVSRIRAIRANASAKSHAELDESVELDAGDPVDLGHLYSSLKAQWPHFNVFGGCCGTDQRHVAAICNAVHAMN